MESWDDSLKRYLVVLLFLFSLLGLPLFFMFIIEPVYSKVPPFLFLFFFIVALPFLASIIAELLSNRAVGLRGGLRTAVRHRGYFNLVYYAVLCSVGFLVVYLLGGFG